MKYIIFNLLLICFSSKAIPQENLFYASIEWSEYEKDISIDYKKSEIKKIKDDLLEYLKENEILEESLSNFHFIDYDLNGVIDIVYSGDAGTETKRTIVFKLGENGIYSKIFDKFGVLISIYQISKFTPLTFVLKENPCCGNNQITYEIYQPINQGDKIELQASSKYCAIIGTELPKTLIDNPILFEVKNELYYLRLTPAVDNEKFNEELNITGNIIAEYTIGAKGYAILERQDETGRVWWFVLMVNNNKPLKSMMDTGSNNENEYYSIGWMSSRYLEIISE